MPIQTQLYSYEDYEAWINSKVLARIDSAKHTVRGFLGTKVTRDDILKVIEHFELELLASSSGYFSNHREHVFLTKPILGASPLGEHYEDMTITFDVGGEATLQIYHNDAAAAKEIYDKIKDQFDPPVKDPSQVKFAFWQMDPDDGCHVTYNRLECPEIDDLRANYSSRVFDEATHIAGLEKPYVHGKIMLWHGPPGNGKTYLIRAFSRLISERHKVCPEVIIDPEALFAQPKYLTSLLLRTPADRKKQPFRLFIAEDCAQLFAADCRNHEGFSRLLNTADGLIGQGQKLVFLFTANEKIDEIDAAILRPGRCLHNMEVKDWSMERASKWLTDKGSEQHIPKLKRKTTLAELYAMVNGTAIARDHKDDKLGF